MNAAEYARQRGWKVGTRLKGIDEFQCVAVIEITAIGRDSVLAVSDETGWESSWTFDCREWTELEQELGTDAEVCDA